MKRIRFGKTNAQVSTIAVGTWAHGGPKVVGKRSVGWGANDPKAAREALLTAFEAGITHWDTADVYGDGAAESLIGRMWEEVPREEVFLASKVGWDPGPHKHFYDPRVMQQQLDRSLRLLKTDYVDLYYLHHCDFGAGNEYLDDALEQMHRFREAGKFLHLGLSDWSATRLARYVDHVQPDVIQPYRNVVDDEFITSGLHEWARRTDAGIAFFSPLKHGLLLGKHESPPELEPGDMRRHVPEFSDPDALRHYHQCRVQIEQKFTEHAEPVLHALTGALLADQKNACVLLGQRSQAQAAAAGKLGEALEAKDAEWVRRIFQRSPTASSHQ